MATAPEDRSDFVSPDPASSRPPPADAARPGGVPDDAAPVPGQPAPRRKPRRAGRAKGSRLVRHFKVDHRLTPEDRAPYEALLFDPRQTADSLLKWLHDRGYTDLSRAGVARHRRQFEVDVRGVRRDARVAVQFAAIARAQGGAAALADAGQFRFEQMFLEQLFRMKKGDERGGHEWLELARTMTSLLGNRREVEEQRADWERRAKEAVAAVEKAAGARRTAPDGVAVADAVRRILGVPLPGEAMPGEALPPARPTGLLPPPSDN